MSTAPSIEFDDNDISGLTANGITESMYSSCDNEGNKYLMMDLFVNHTSNDKDVSKNRQCMVHRGCNPLHFSTAG
jgi:hypothetical protein